MYKNLPLSLKELPQWVNWYKKGPEQVKIPINPANLKAASTSDPTTWGTFDHVIDNVMPTLRAGVDGIGFVFTRGDPFVGIDLDDCLIDGVATEETQELIDKLDSYTEVSPSGEGLHIIVMAAGIDRSLKEKGLEIYPHGRYFCMTGDIYAGRGQINYRLQQTISLYPDTDNAIPDGLTVGFPAPDGEKSGIKYLSGERNNKMTSLAGLLRQKGYGEEQIYRALSGINASVCDPPMTAEEIRAIARSMSRYKEGATFKPQLPGGAPDATPQETNQDSIDSTSQSCYIVNKHQQIKTMRTNALLWLQTTGRHKYNFRYNSLTCERECNNERLDEVTLIHIADDIEKSVNHAAWPVNVVDEAVSRLCGSNTYDPAKDWLNSIVWDGKCRIDRAFEEDFALPQSDYSKAISRAFHLQICGRIMQPGCFADQALMVIGHQGAGKSRWCRNLMPSPNWFIDTLLHNVDNKDTPMALQGRIVIEIPEMSALNKSDQEAVKGFITRREDKFRPPYGRTTNVYPRRCVIVITTNNETPLTDSTGGRRYWIVNVGSSTPDAPEDCAILQPSRYTCDQRFAEAYIAFKEGESWYYNEPDAVEMQEAAVEKDGLAGMVEKALSRFFSHDFTTADIAETMEIRPEGFTRSIQMRIANALRELGYSKRKILKDGVRAVRWSKMWSL